MPVKILFVDDETKLQAVITQLFKYKIKDHEYEVQFAVNGVEALEILKADPQIDIVLTDLNMPRMNGLTLLSHLQELRPKLNPVLTAIVISAYNDLENIRRAMNTGAFDFLTKPLDFSDMKLTLEKAVAHVNRLRDAYQQEQQAKAQLRQMNEELERRVEERTAELNAFARTVAHDLKNPLGVVMGYIEYTFDFYREMNIEELAEVLSAMRQYTYKSINIIDELLLLAGVRQLQVPLAPVDMAYVVNEAYERLSLMFEKHNGRLVQPKSWPTALGYAPWLEEVWVNYLSNGLKYGGESPCLEVGGELLANGSVRFWVKDYGEGIPPEKQTRLFTEFARLSDVRAEGHGLGLSIVRRIIERLNGEVGVESTPDQGSLFYFTLPPVGDFAAKEAPSDVF